MNNTIKIPDLARFCSAFGAVGLRVGSRIGADKRTKDDKEWFVVRRFLKEGLLRRIVKPPVSVRKDNPPEPDFVLELGDENIVAFLEITEASDPADQREMTKFEHSKKTAMLLGDFGGRFADGASQPGRAWVSDVLDALGRKSTKVICSPSETSRHLVIYPNSNASFLLSSDKDECVAFAFLREAIASRRDKYVGAANGCFVHVLGKERVCFDILGKSKLVRRRTSSTKA
jgi:hypothetical protein